MVIILFSLFSQEVDITTEFGKIDIRLSYYVVRYTTTTFPSADEINTDIALVTNVNVEFSDLCSLCELRYSKNNFMRKPKDREHHHMITENSQQVGQLLMFVAALIVNNWRIVLDFKIC